MPRLRLAILALAAAFCPASLLADDAALESALSAARADVRGFAPAAAPLATASVAPLDPCAESRMTPASPVRGEAAAIWAESSVCLPYPLAAVWKASMETDVMAWEGTTRFNKTAVLSPDGSPRRLSVDYESRKRYLGVCHTAHWPMVWTHRVTKGDPKSPEEGVVGFTRVDGGDFNGSFIKLWKGSIELRAYSADKVSARMRYEIVAPTQKPDTAAGAVLAYFDRLKRRAGGEKLPGPADNPDCPY